MTEIVEFPHGILVSFCLSYGPSYYFPRFTASLIGRYGSFVLPAVMGGTRIALLLQSTLTHGLQWTLSSRARS